MSDPLGSRHLEKGKSLYQVTSDVATALFPLSKNSPLCFCIANPFCQPHPSNFPSSAHQFRLNLCLFEAPDPSKAPQKPPKLRVCAMYTKQRHKFGEKFYMDFLHLFPRKTLIFTYIYGKITPLDVRRSGRLLLSSITVRRIAGNFRGVCPSKSGEDEQSPRCE